MAAPGTAGEPKALKSKATGNGKAADTSAVAARTYTGSIFPGPDGSISAELAAAIHQAEAAFGCPVWSLIHERAPSDHPFEDLDEDARKGFFAQLEQLRDCDNGVALIVDSRGGSAREAYRIAMMLRRNCTSFRALVPRIAKSAATLLILGAADVYMGREAELGPLDVQVLDFERERFLSALDEVQALERLHSAALEQIDQTIFLLRRRMPYKKIETVLPHALNFVSESMRPLIDKIDTVHYTEQSRMLKVAEDYAVRLLQPRYSKMRAQRIAGDLVNKYPEHGFAIGIEEAGTILDLPETNNDQQMALGRLCSVLTFGADIMLGRLVEVPNA